MSRPEIDFGGYIEDIPHVPSECVGIEIEGVRQEIIVDDEWGVTVDNNEPEFFSVYLRKSNGEARCIGDFEHYADAYAYADECATKILISSGRNIPLADGYFASIASQYRGTLEQRALGMAGAIYLSIDLPRSPSRDFAACHVLLSTHHLQRLPTFLQVLHPSNHHDAENLHDAVRSVAAFLKEHLQAVENEAITQLRLAGYAVVRFSPDELEGVDPHTLQNRLVELGNQAIDDLRDDSPGNDMEVSLEEAYTSSGPGL
jgi:hypothetical protein